MAMPVLISAVSPGGNTTFTAATRSRPASPARGGGSRGWPPRGNPHEVFPLGRKKPPPHSVARPPSRGGRGAVVRESVDAGPAKGLNPALSPPPWNRHEPSYGDSPRYNNLY